MRPSRLARTEIRIHTLVDGAHASVPAYAARYFAVADGFVEIEQEPSVAVVHVPTSVIVPFTSRRKVISCPEPGPVREAVSVTRSPNDTLSFETCSASAVPCRD